MRIEDLSLADLAVLREQLAQLEKIGRIDPLARFDLTPGRPVRVELPSFNTPEEAENTRGGLSPVAREGEAIAEIPPSPDEAGASVPVSDDCEPVAPAGEVAPPAAPVAAAVPAGAGEQPAPAVPDAAALLSGRAEPDDDLGQHLWHMPRKGGWDFAADHRLMELACLGWPVPEIGAEMGRPDLEVKRRFDLLVKSRVFKREAVRDRLAAFLALAEAAE